jgi:hypothetical protein
MPIKLQPKKYEEKKDFNRRCMNNASMMQDYKDRDHRFEVCQTLWTKNFSPKK